MVWIRRVRTASGATAVQIVESVDGRRRIVRHIGSARDEAELGLLMEQARQLLVDDGHRELDLGITPKAVKTEVVPPPTATLFTDTADGQSRARLVAIPRVLKSCSGMLYDVLAGVYADLGFDAAVDDRVFPDLVIARVVEPTSLLDVDRILAELGRTTIIPIVKAFQDRHQITDMVVVADAGMLSATKLGALDETGLRFIVGSRVTNAPGDLESHFHWHGEVFTDGQIIYTITPRHQRAAATKTSNPKIKAEPVWNPAVHTRSRRAVWAYSTKRAVRDNKTINLQEAKARAVVDGDKAARTPRFVTTCNGAQQLDAASLARAGSPGRIERLCHQHRRRAHARGRGHRQLSRPVAYRADLPHVQD